MSEPETLKRSPVAVTAVFMVWSRLPAIRLAPVELNAKPVALLSVTEPSDRAARGPAPFAVGPRRPRRPPEMSR